MVNERANPTATRPLEWSDFRWNHLSTSARLSPLDILRFQPHLAPRDPARVTCGLTAWVDLLEFLDC